MAKFTLGSIGGDVAVCQQTQQTKSGVYRCVKMGKGPGKPSYNRGKLLGRKRKVKGGWSRSKRNPKYRYDSKKVAPVRRKKSSHAYFTKARIAPVVMAKVRGLAGIGGKRKRSRKTRRSKRG